MQGWERAIDITLVKRTQPHNTNTQKSLVHTTEKLRHRRSYPRLSSRNLRAGAAPAMLGL